jgi:hypothetical protein
MGGRRPVPRGVLPRIACRPAAPDLDPGRQAPATTAADIGPIERSIARLRHSATPPRRTAHAALQHIAHAELSPYLPYVNGFAPVDEARIARDYEQQLIRDSPVMMSSTIPSAKYSCAGSSLIFWNGRTAIEGLSGSASRCEDFSGGVGSVWLAAYRSRMLPVSVPGELARYQHQAAGLH